MATTEQIIIQLKDEFTATMNKVNAALVKTQTEGTKAGEVFKGMFGLQTLNKGVEIAKRVVEFSMEALQNWNKQKDVIKTFTRDDIMAEKQLKELREEGGGIMPIEEMTAAWQRLKLRGIDPTSKQMKAFADIAKSQNKSVASLGDSVSHALMGHYRGLMEFGIQTKKVGDQLQMSFMGHTQMIKDSKEAMMDYLTSVGQMPGVKGAVENTNPLQRAQGKFKESEEAAGKAIAEALAPSFTTFLEDITHILDKIPKLLGDTISNKERDRNALLSSNIGQYQYYKEQGDSKMMKYFEERFMKEMPGKFKGLDINKDQDKIQPILDLAVKQSESRSKAEEWTEREKDFDYQINKDQEENDAIIKRLQEKLTDKGYSQDQITKGMMTSAGIDKLFIESGLDVSKYGLEYKANVGRIHKNVAGRALVHAKSEEYNEQADALDKALSVDNKSTNETGTENQDAADELSSITSGAPKIFNINIQELIHEQIIQANTLTESKEQIKKIAIEALTDGLNNVQAIAQK